MNGETDTSLIQRADGKDSTVFGVSIRAWLALIPVWTVCASYLLVVCGVVTDAILNKDWSKVGTFANVGEPLYTVTVVAIGFYFGQKTSQK